ncbi:hypothetical protein [Vibrio bivalvicida]|uniref:Transposase n=1 Tax=Vibrio bivalvicida TaxID=1276888 RepID=A0ABV4MQF5_9VIBR
MEKNAFEEAHYQVRKTDLATAAFQYPRSRTKELDKHTHYFSKLTLVDSTTFRTVPLARYFVP